MPIGDMGDYIFIGTGEDFRPGAVGRDEVALSPRRQSFFWQHVPRRMCLSRLRSATNCLSLR